jgi:hypothetical protein
VIKEVVWLEVKVVVEVVAPVGIKSIGDFYTLSQFLIQEWYLVKGREKEREKEREGEREEEREKEREKGRKEKKEMESERGRKQREGNVFLKASVFETLTLTLTLSLTLPG